MKFVVDMMLSTRVADELRGRGSRRRSTCVNKECSARPDDEILTRAAPEQRILISAEMDFGFLLVSRQDSWPSIVLLRRLPFHSNFVVSLLLANLAQLAEALEQGSLVVLEESRIRVRRQPFFGSEFG